MSDILRMATEMGGIMGMRAILGRKSGRRGFRDGVVTAGLVLALGATGLLVSATTAAPAAAAKPNKIVVAFPVGLSPNYIFPIMPAQDFAEQNLSYFTYLLFRPLYWYGTGA